MSCVDTMIHIMGKTFVLFAKLCGIKRISDKTRPTVCDGTFVGLGQFFGSDRSPRRGNVRVCVCASVRPSV